MGMYRSKLEIIADVLGVIGEGAKKTHIMYGANLSYTLICRYLDWVVGAGLVRAVKGSEALYMVTAKGKTFLERYEKFSKRRERLHKWIDDVEGEKAELERMCSVSGDL